jgi:hypothetical protein
VSVRRRIERAEAMTGAQACPCRRPERIEIVEGPRGDGRADAGPCDLCGSPRAVRVIEAVKPEGSRT